MNIGKQFKEGMITNNPVLVQLLGMCSTMAITKIGRASCRERVFRAV